MAEYMSREDAQKIICDWCGVLTNPTLEDLEKCDDICPQFARTPTADVRPVVLCKDCKWTETDGMEDPAIYCEKWDRWEMPPDGFCWLGKKRKER